MASNREIDPKTEGGLFSFVHGLTGYYLAAVLLVVLCVILMYFAIKVQSENATNFYKIDNEKLKFNSPDNHKLFINEGDKNA